MNQEYYSNLKQVLRIRHTDDIKLVRIGRDYDGGYVMADPGKDGIAYSFGIGDDVSWDNDMARRGYEIFMYDMTIDSPPSTHFRFHFFKEGIGSKKTGSLDTLDNFIARNNHEDKYNMILKMDVEGAEWDFLDTVSSATLRRFSQLVFEFHHLTDPNNKTLSLFRKINTTHIPIHVHGNNCGSAMYTTNVGTIPDTLEVTYLRPDGHVFLDNKVPLLPSCHDRPNNPLVPEILLGRW